MKMVNKDKLTYVDGYLIDDDNIIAIDPSIVRQANMLEEMVQRRKWVDEQPEACAGPDYSKFKRESEHDIKGIEFIAETPLMDEEIQRSLELMAEIDDANMANRINEKIQNDLKNLIDFVSKDYVIDRSGNCAPEKFDLPTLGNPLDLTKESICIKVAEAYGCPMLKADNE